MPIFDDIPNFLKDLEEPNPQPEERYVETGSKKSKKFDRWKKFERQDNPLPDRANSLVVDRLLNESGVAEGPTVAPEIKGGIRVLPVSEFRVVHQEEGKFCTRFILSWLENPQMTLWQPQYAVYTFAQQTALRWHGQNLNSTIWDGPLQDPVLTVAPPCEVVVWGYQRQPVIFAVQTRLSNGMVSDPATMPTCARTCDPYWFRDRTVTASYSATIDDETIWADATAGNITITLFDCRQLSKGRTYTVKKIDSSANTVTVQGFTTAQTIDGAVTYVIGTAQQSNDFRNDRTSAVWRIV